MSLVTLKNEFNEDVLACRACLATNRKLYSIHQDRLLKSYMNLVGQEACPYDTLPQYICNYCSILLLKYEAFRDHCQKATYYLEEARIKGKNACPYDTLPQYICNYCSILLLKYEAFRDHCQKATYYLEEARIKGKNITLNYLSNFQPYIQHEKSEIKHVSVDDNDIADENLLHVKIDDNIDDFGNVDQFAYPSENTENLNIYAETVNIKIESEQVSRDEPLKNVKKKKNTPLRKKTAKQCETVEKKGKYFETKENMIDFEKAFDVDIIVLSEEQQKMDVLDRKTSSNYLHSPYKCELCFKGYMGADILKKHVLAQHDPSRGSVVCEFCQFRYKDRRGLNQHLKSHRLKFSCKKCSYVSRTTIACGVCKPNLCHICPVQTEIGFNAKEHFKMHGGQMHECRHCGKSYEKLSSHLSHLRMHHPSQFIWCDVCGEAFIGAFGLNAHKKRAHRHLPLPAACRACHKHFAVTSALDRHSTRGCCSEHSCLHCGEGFDIALDLRDHLLDKHRSCKVYACEKCDKTFTRESLYSAHYRRIHVDPKDKPSRKKERPWVCEVCGKSLPNRSMLLYHQRNHTGERPYQCPQCPKGFTMKKLLQSHLRVHTNDRPYTCKLCPKAFKGLSALRTHEHIHSGGQTKATKNRIMQ